MRDMPKIHYKGDIIDIDTDIDIWYEKINSISICYKESLQVLEYRGIAVFQVIMEKITLIESMDKEEIRSFIEKETGEKLRQLNISRIIFDFAAPEDGVCSVDLFLNPGEIFGGFNVHLRLHGDEPRIEMCGLS